MLISSDSTNQLTQASKNHLDTCDAQFETDQVDYTYHDMVGYKNICNEYRNILRHKLDSELHTFIQDLKYAQKCAGTFKTQLADCYRECTVAEYYAQIQLYTEYQRLYRECTDRYNRYYSDQTACNIMNDNLGDDLKHTINTFYGSLVRCQEWLESCLHRYGERLDEAYDNVDLSDEFNKGIPEELREYRFEGKFYPETLIIFKMSMMNKFMMVALMMVAIMYAVLINVAVVEGCADPVDCPSLEYYCNSYTGACIHDPW
ncbi:unnamed protein product [Medioppia subpectinata]|uniref:Uncharacterized protein n=1 Tax=Medioppia subpectinata TaxID=1979941 RepID=A0A7R9KZL1_9ACAR|nr:unnamed protein product [Medioppia subpectinata]CAG2111627.1 unnamed protein product [Medioppia subpectinata]